jgi:NADPH:quinone reductase-like Zn-dependent oxidoreductase
VFLRQFASSVGLGPKVRAVMMHPDAEGLRWIAGHYEAKRIRVQIDEVFPLERLADAHRKSIGGRARGKIVISVTA